MNTEADLRGNTVLPHFAELVYFTHMTNLLPVLDAHELNFLVIV